MFLMFIQMFGGSFFSIYTEYIRIHSRVTFFFLFLFLFKIAKMSLVLGKPAFGGTVQDKHKPVRTSKGTSKDS